MPAGDTADDPCHRLSGGSEFHDALASTTSTIPAVAALGSYTDEDVWAPVDPMALAKFVSAHDEAVLVGALASEALVVHVASHMHDRGDGEPAFYRRDAELPVGEVAGWLDDRQRRIRAACVLAEAATPGPPASARPFGTASRHR